MYIILTLISIVGLGFVLYHYFNHFLSAFLARLLKCTECRLSEVGLRRIGRIKLRFGVFTLDLSDVRLSSSFWNQELTKPFYVQIGDFRVEKRSKEGLLTGKPKLSTENENQDQTGPTLSNQPLKLSRIWHWLQYFGCQVGSAHFALLDDVSDSMLHFSAENLTLETFRDRSGIQLELQFLLAQLKLFKRSNQSHISLADIQLTGHLSVDVSDQDGRPKKIGVNMKQPKISLSDTLFDYLLEHPHLLTKQPSNHQSENSCQPTTISRLLSDPPSFDVQTSDFQFEFLAVQSHDSIRTISLTLAKVDAQFKADEKNAVIKFHDLQINDHDALSRFQCAQFATVLKKKKNEVEDEEETKLPVDLDIKFSRPKIELYKHDLAWWMDYCRTKPFDQLATMFKERTRKREETRDKQDKSIIIVNLEISEFQCILRTRKGALLSVVSDLIVFSSDSTFKSAEFGVESLWCHRGHAADFPKNQPNFDRHQFGTVVSIGGGLAEIQRLDERKLKVQCQLDECQFEWEEATMRQIVEFAKLFKKPKNQENEADLERENDADQGLEVLIQVSAKKLAFFFTAKKAAFIALWLESLRLSVASPQLRIHATASKCKLGTAHFDQTVHRAVHCEWWRSSGRTAEPKMKNHGNCDKLAVKYQRNQSAASKLIIEPESDLDLCWSTLGYAVFYEVVKKSKEMLQSFKSTVTHPSPPMELQIKSEYSVELGFELPREHFMRWVVPSLSIQRTNGDIILAAPNFMLELDSQIILTVEEVQIDRRELNALMDLSRKEFKSLAEKTNKCWSWSAQALHILFPYQFDFAKVFEEVLNAVKWMKLLHNVQKKLFTADSPLPADLRISVKEATLKMADDPFEINLQLIYEVLKDEVVERERRRQMLEQKLEQLMKENLLLSDAKVDALYQSLKKKNEQIYCERINKVQKQPKRHLLTWRIKDLDIKAFADKTLHGKDNVVRLMRQFNSEAPVPESFGFSTLWARCVEFDLAEWTMQFRDYPLPYLDLKDAHFWGTLCGAEHLAGNRSQREATVTLPEPWGEYTVLRNMCPLKFYYDIESEITDLRTTYGPCWEPCLSMISLCWRYINAPSKDPSPPLSFWDKVRLLLHGRFTALMKKLCTSMLASPDPYNDTELVEITWENFEFDWVTGQFRVHTDLDAYIRTASKYDDSRLLHLPNLKLMIALDWACMADQHDHHNVTPIAPNKLPDYVTVGGHDSYRAFRSEHVDIQLQLEAIPSLDPRNAPQILLYANTFRWLDFMKNTLTMVNRPVKRGKVFNEPIVKRHQLSRHFRNIHLNVTLPRFLISYWMSFSSSYGVRMISEGLRLTSSMVMNSAPQPSEQIKRRKRRAVKANHVSVQLEKAQIHLFGEKRQPSPADGLTDDHADSFFMGLSRLNYVRESEAEQNKLTPLPKHRRTASLTAKLQNAAGRTPDQSKGGVNQSASSTQLNADKRAVHRLTIHDLRGAWTTENRDACLAIMDGVQKAYLLRKVLSNDAMKMFSLDAAQQTQQTRQRQAYVERVMERRESKLSELNSPEKDPMTGEAIVEDESEEMLWKLINEAETNLVAYSEDTVEPPTNSLLGVLLCAMDDVVLNNWQVDLLNSQVVLKGHETDSFILVSAARASITQRFHLPVWRNSQLLLKRSYAAFLSGMQYFAPLTIQQNQRTDVPLYKRFQWLSREIIEEKDPRQPHDKVNNYSRSGEAVGGVVTAPVERRQDDESTANSTVQMQRVASRCSCQMFFCYYSDLINMEKFEDFVVPQITDEKEAKFGERKDDIDCFTLKHNMLEVSTNPDQYQVILDIVNNLVLFVDPKKKLAQEKRRRLWFELAKLTKNEVGEAVQRRQNELREVVAHIRALERQNFFAQLQSSQGDESVDQINEERQQQIEKFKQHQVTLIDELALTISVCKEKSVEEQTAFNRRLKAQNEDESRDNVEYSEIARRFEVCFEDCIWRLTEADGQLSITEVQIRNFLYNRTARVDNSGEHLLEIGSVKVLNLLPNSKYRETLARLPNPKSKPESTDTDKTPAIRVICRELPPVGGISVKEHFEVNIVPMQAQITYRFFEKMMAFFFPGRQIDKEDQNLDVEEASHPQQSFWLAKRFRGAVNSSFRASRLNLATNDQQKGQSADEIDKMKERADKNNMFVYIIIPPVPFIVSYKGNKEKNIEDIDRFNLTFPLCEYHNKNWTWLDLSLAIKKSYRNILVQQFMKQKILRKSLQTQPEPVDEEEKKRIVLGNTDAINIKKKHRK
ncbi:unnamed protein product [Bursaphelenchus okinawaensis]|uniref:FMP27/BLTP2/Hobbit GFWDK motif-containing RBG unit domain-containing protein n=1 Tax=Bursaphelenchus okinawaensis TaxID=465554 RepID=A0A811JX62_9BILA|nr:unnamed protein product [Bursaphelenchus okinawaensis]CAG9086450.1 unnamed protein product [Bursaphelenchus okinawaensis]